MKSIRNIFLVTIAGIAFTSFKPSFDTYTLSKDYIVTINGTSNLHKWDETVGKVSGTGTINWNSDGSFDLNAINIKMEVASIKSDMGSIMNNNTYKALKASKNPEIIFSLVAPVTSIHPQSNETAFSVKGNLSIAGVTKPIDMTVKVLMQENKKLLFEGSQSINMTDYGIDPPTALLGTLKTGNKITITFKTSFTSTTSL